MRKKHDTHRVALAVTPGAPIFELAVPCEVFGVARPDLADPWYEFQVCATEPETVVASGFLSTGAGTLDDLVHADTVIVPACTNVHDRQPAQLVDAIREAHVRGARIAGICSGAFVLAEAGLLDGRHATTHWMYATELSRRYPSVRVDATVLYAEDGGIFTSAGTVAAIDLCLELVRRDHGTAVANALARRLVTPPHRTADQAQYMSSPIPETNDLDVGATIQWARQHLDENLKVRDLAKHAHVSERTLIRRFAAIYGSTPSAWLTIERLRHAQELLETTTLPIERVATVSGFGTAASLRAAFARNLHTSPSAYRKTWQLQPEGSEL